MKLLSLILAIPCFVFSSSLKAQRAEPGKVKSLLQQSRWLTKADTSNKFILLDFWTTWCGPCIAAFPKLDSLQQQYASRLQIVALSPQREDSIQHFLNKKPFKQIDFVSDTTRELEYSFGITAYPTTILLNPLGNIIWTGQSEDLPQQLPALFEKKEVVSFDAEPAPASNKTISQSLVSFNISQSLRGTSYMAKLGKADYAPVEFKYRNCPVSEVVEDMLGLNPVRLCNYRTDLDTINVDMDMRFGLSHCSNAEIRRMFVQSIGTTFGFTVRYFDTLVTGCQLSFDKVKMEKHIEPVPGGGFIKTDNEFIHFWRMDAEGLAIWFEKKTKEYANAVKGAGTECYTFTIPFSKEAPQLIESLKKVGVNVSRQIISVNTAEVR